MKFLVSLVLFSVLINPAASQFTCTMSATDEDTCLAQTDDSDASCVWCSMSGFGFCVAEAQAEAMEQALPNIQCDRKDKPDNDDDAVDPTTDDDVAPNDDSVPDNYWTCLKAKTKQACDEEKENDGCTWCTTKAGFGLCMTGPSAESAAHSDWFDCSGSVPQDDEEEDVVDPYDTACALAYLQNPTADGCTSSADADGNACEWCELQGVGNLCLNGDQADAAEALGVTCGQTSNPDDVTDPYDTACALAYLQNPTEDGCLASADADGNACEWCELQGVGNLCLNEDQAEAAQVLGVTCDSPDQEEEEDVVEDPYDTSCALAYLQNPTEDGCTSTADSDGNACEWCELQGVGNLCLNSDQAEAAQALGVTCDASNKKETALLRGA